MHTPSSGRLGRCRLPNIDVVVFTPTYNEQAVTPAVLLVAPVCVREGCAELRLVVRRGVATVLAPRFECVQIKQPNAAYCYQRLFMSTNTEWINQTSTFP
jgi:hypothetical protein